MRIAERCSSYIYLRLHQLWVGRTRIRTLFLAIMWTKKFMNTRDEYRMIRLSLAVIVLEFPSWSDLPLPPSSHPNRAYSLPTPTAPLHFSLPSGHLETSRG